MEERQRRKLAVILHADVVGSTTLVQRDETLAHERIRDSFRRFSETIKAYGGSTHELRGDALVAEFDRASDAVCAALAFQADNAQFNDGLDGDVRPELRVGISMGEMVIADRTVTGPGVVLAQRLEQLAEPGGVIVQGAAHETIPRRLPFEYKFLGEREVKGFDEPVRAYAISLTPGQIIPSPEGRAVRKGKWFTASIVGLVLIVAGGLVWFQPWVVREEPVSAARTSHPLPDKPSIAILPFTNMSDDPEQEYFADGITEDIITALSRFGELFVIARNSTFVYKGKAVDARQIGNELGASYLVEGSVRRENNRLRINAQLIDVSTGSHIWAEKFDKEFQDVFAIQDEITRSITGQLVPEITRAGAQKLRSNPTSNLDAWDLYLQSSAAFSAFNQESLREAISKAEAAIQRDPNFAAPHVIIARSKGWQYFYGWTDDPEKTLSDAIEHAKTAIRLDNTDASGYSAMGYLHRFHRNEAIAVSNLERAVDLNPNDATIRLELAHVLDWFRLQEKALPQILEAIRLSPRDPRLQMMYFFKAHILFHLNKFDASLEASRQMSSTITSKLWQVNYHLVRAASLAELGRSDEAMEEIQSARAINSKLSLEFIKNLFVIANNHPENRNAWLASLEKAGMPIE